MHGTNLVLFEPEADWVPKLEFPDIAYCKRVSIDVETCDPNLTDLGPGTFRKDSFPVGISFSTDTGFKRYYPFAHQGGGNLPKEAVTRYFKDAMKRTDLEVVGTNILYDLEYLRTMGIEVKGRIRDVNIAEPLIDENSPHGYGLDGMGYKYLGKRKENTLMNEALATYGLDTKSRRDLWRLHSKYVGAYAEWDAEAPLQVYAEQCKQLDAQNLWGVYNLECELIPILLEMRFQGVRVDLNKAKLLRMQLTQQENQMLAKLRKEVGFNINVRSQDHLVAVCKQNGWHYPTTDKGNPSFTKLFLRNTDNEFFKQVAALRSISMLRTMFVEDLVSKYATNGRIHATFQQVLDDDGGTVTGRFSCNNPNLQQIPARDPIIAPLIRGLFVPEEGEKWAKLDYSQQEPRILVHYASLMKFRGAAEVLAAYKQDKAMDFYTNVASSSGLKRKPAKDLTLGICYGEGRDKIARDLGVDLDKADKIKKQFNDVNPFVSKMAEAAMDRVHQMGYVKTLLGRRARFELWEPVNRNQEMQALPLEAAQKRYPGMRLKRAYAYKALNRIIQGSAADMTKAAMVKCYQEHKKIPLSTVHDELNFSVDSEALAGRLQHTMENCVDIQTPIYAELQYGDCWK